jgi:hypothetical protein
MEVPALLRESRAKAIKEIATVPPRLLFYSILGAVGLVLSGCDRNVVAARNLTFSV